MPENDVRQTAVLHESEVDTFADPWQLGDYGDGWGLYAVIANDPAREHTIKSSPRREAMRVARWRTR